jgi:hypothetical protein
MLRMSFYETRCAATRCFITCLTALSVGCGDDAHCGEPEAEFADLPQVASGDAGAHDGGSHAGHALDAGARLDASVASPLDASGHPEDVLCPPDFPKFSDGLSARVNDLTVRLVTVDPRPPRQLVDNDWTIALVDASGAPLVGAAVLSADTWMTVHNHGGRWEPTIEPLAAAGQFVLRGLDFKMRGPWLVRITLQPAPGARPLAARFAICVE